jgi:hypothetical protein
MQPLSTNRYRRWIFLKKYEACWMVLPKGGEWRTRNKSQQMNTNRRILKQEIR